jgi:hypothetical protein
MSGVTVEHAGQACPAESSRLSSQPRLSWQPSRKSRIIVALSAPVFAITAIAASGGLSATASAQPVSQMGPVSQVRAVRMAGATSVQAVRASTLTFQAVAVTTTKHRKRMTPKQIAWNIMHWFGWKAKWQFRYLNRLWTRESSWNKYATNPYSGAYGIPQAVPGGKMASCGRDWRTSAKTQIRWGMRYIRRTYGSPKRAWDHEINDGWY